MKSKKPQFKDIKDFVGYCNEYSNIKLGRNHYILLNIPDDCFYRFVEILEDSGVDFIYGIDCNKEHIVAVYSSFTWSDIR